MKEWKRVRWMPIKEAAKKTIAISAVIAGTGTFCWLLQNAVSQTLALFV